jgi:hypothetical protein
VKSYVDVTYAVTSSSIAFGDQSTLTHEHDLATSLILKTCKTIMISFHSVLAPMCFNVLFGDEVLDSISNFEIRISWSYLLVIVA